MLFNCAQNRSLITSPTRLSLVPPPCTCMAPGLDARAVSSLFLVLSSRKREDGLTVKSAVLDPGSTLEDDGSGKSSGTIRTLQLGVMFGV
ncbi:hypothetical protein SAY86_030301 [Trapa natans]|uniref:Uncharacterized protein n=1 Tax=Trapa natans TaxID=22666 RepID=A0AAN7RDL4_TRANT|nr:hypothetical protein SAY86_030301 [Trapa natans]